MVLVGRHEPYLEYCLKSIEDLVDEIVILRPNNENVMLKIDDDIRKLNHPEKCIEVVEDLTGELVDFAGWRNKVLDKAKGGYCLWLDSDEVLAKVDGSPVKRHELEALIRANMGMDNFIFPTVHFMYNFFTLDGRNNGQHWCMRLFKNDGRRFEKKVHEYIPMKEEKTVRVTDVIVWHFGHVKGMQDLLNRYKERHIKDNPFTGKMDEKEFNEYMRTHHVLRGRDPTIRYDGPLPHVMGLW